MDPLKSLMDNIPDWLKRIDELSGQIEQRQLDLAKLRDQQPPSSARSIRNVGSTESLKPKDDGAAYPTAHRDVTPPPPPPLQTSSTQQGGAQAPPSPNSDPKTPSSIQRQTNEVVAVAQKRARATLRKRQKTESMISTDGPAPTYRTRRMIIVYYDSYVQSFFEELVKFVSAQRNLMRKAKMAAKVAEIKRLAELEMPDDDDDDEDMDDALQPGDAMIAADPNLSARKPRLNNADELKLRYVSTRQMGPTTRLPNLGLVHMRGTDSGPNAPIASSFGRGLGSFDQGGGDVFDDVDRGLEFVQGMCERAAHQFLRDGECSEEVEKIKKRLGETNELATKEMERILKENPDALKAAVPPKIRSYRPSSMRRDPGASSTHSKKAKLAVDDEGVEDM
jgi:hypothetical protein